ncbi:hypothetical protein SUGI_0496450 [Cryptomeria japonica]|nr:hypothetical protein SUGI_0496450 [Cryptomeria japonica]
MALVLGSQNVGWVPLVGDSIVEVCNAALHEVRSHEEKSHVATSLDSHNLDPKTDKVGSSSGEAHASTWKCTLVGNPKTVLSTQQSKVTVANCLAPLPPEAKQKEKFSSSGIINEDPMQDVPPPCPPVTDKVEDSVKDSMEMNNSQVPVEDDYPFLEGILNIMKTPDPKRPPPPHSSGNFLGLELEEGEISRREEEQEGLKVKDSFREKKGNKEVTPNVLKMLNPNTIGDDGRGMWCVGATPTPLKGNDLGPIPPSTASCADSSGEIIGTFFSQGHAG